MWLLIFVLVVVLGLVALSMLGGDAEYVSEPDLSPGRDEDDDEDDERLRQICGWHHYGLGRVCSDCAERHGPG